MMNTASSTANAAEAYSDGTRPSTPRRAVTVPVCTFGVASDVALTIASAVGVGPSADPPAPLPLTSESFAAVGGMGALVAARVYHRWGRGMPPRRPWKPPTPSRRTPQYIQNRAGIVICQSPLFVSR